MAGIFTPSLSQRFCSPLPSSRCVNFQYTCRFSKILSSSSSSSPSPSVNLHSLRVPSKKEQSRHLLRASSSGEIPNELVEDSKFVPLNAEDPVYGPPALLLLGFDAKERAKIQQLLKELDGEFLKVIYCTEDMISLTVWDAMHTQQQNLEAVKIAKSLPRMCILSGLSGEEMLMFIDAYPESGLAPAVFAALVPNSANKLLGEVMEEIMGDHEMVSSKQ